MDEFRIRLINSINYYGIVLIFFFISCKKERQEEYKLFEHSGVKAEMISEELLDYKIKNSKNTLTLEYILSYNEDNVIDEEYWKRILFEFNYNALNASEIEISSNLIKLYGQLGDKLGRIEFKNFKGKVKIIKPKKGKYIIRMLNPLTIDVKYNDSIIKEEKLFNQGDELIFKR